jgi:uroporphyrinogen decarboxylase
MNHRQRVLTALRHQEPDRVPIDLGGTVDSTIMAVAYKQLREHLNLGAGRTRVADVYQHTALVEEDVRQALGIDVRGVFDEPNEWRQGSLPDGSPAEFPAKFLPQLQNDGSQVIFDAAGNVVLKMPRNGHYFDPVYSPLADATSVRDIEKHMADIESYDKPAHLDKGYEELAKKAKRLHENTDYLLVGFFGGHIFQSSQSLRGWETFLMDLLVNQKFAEALMDHLAEANMRRFERYAETVGQYVHVVQFEDDLGMQNRPLLRPDLYRKVVKPYHEKLFRFVKSRLARSETGQSGAYLLLHTDGAVSPFIPDFIEMGVDILNPVQVSATRMDTKELKREFGRDITFWGGGCDSQNVLPFGTPEEVADEVKRRIDDLAPGGGFVFSPIHNVQTGVPPENVVAMFKTAQEYGVTHG